MTVSNTEQTISLDSYPDTPLDQFPDALQRVRLSEVGLDGITDVMSTDLQTGIYTVQDRADANWTKVT